MRYQALATDYDGTIASQGVVDEPTLAALRRVRDSGRKLLLVTGRELPDLFSVFDHATLFDRIVAENGAVIYRPATEQVLPLIESPARSFVDLLRERGVSPLSVGRVIVATTEPNESVVLQSIRDSGLELQVIFNKGAVMILPSGVNKATGLKAALKELSLSAHNVVGIGDAENDHAFLELCEFSAAVGNALPALKERADWVSTQRHGAAAAELVEALLATDLQSLDQRVQRHHITLGVINGGSSIQLAPYASRVLVTGDGQVAPRRVVGTVLARLCQQRYQTCTLDPEGNHLPLHHGITFGGSGRAPTIPPIVQALEQPQNNVIVSLSGLKLTERPAFLEQLLQALGNLRANYGRPHWLVLFEAEQLLPRAPGLCDVQPMTDPDLGSVLLASTKVAQIADSCLRAVNFVCATGSEPLASLAEFCAARPCKAPPGAKTPLGDDEALAWVPGRDTVARFRVSVDAPDPQAQMSGGVCQPEEAIG